MANPWDPTHLVSPELARELIEAQFPELMPAQVAPLGSGWDNTVLRVNGTLAFRFPRREIAVPLLETELRVLPRLQLPLPVPKPLYTGRPGAGYPWPFYGHEALPGVSADAAQLSEEQRLLAAAPLGAFLRALHAQPAGDAAPGGAGRTDVERLLRELRARQPEVVPFAERVATQCTAPEPRALVHGDLHSRQLLFHAGTLSGVIDWGDAHFNDPAVDLSVAFSFLQPAARPAFFEAYGAAAPPLSRLIALHVSAATLMWAVDLRDEPLEREARLALCYAQLP